MIDNVIHSFRSGTIKSSSVSLLPFADGPKGVNIFVYLFIYRHQTSIWSFANEKSLVGSNRSEP
jgi:hypothetical protein